MPRQAASGGRRWSIAAVVLYLVILLLLPGSLGGSLILVPIAMVFSAVAWRRDRPSRFRRSAAMVTLVIVALSVPLLVFHLIWGDLS